MNENSTDYEALANSLQGRCGKATLFLRIHLAGRKTGVRETCVRTVKDKLAARHFETTCAHAERILHLYSEVGLGWHGTRYNKSVIFWNPRIDLFRLARCLEARARRALLVSRMPTLGKGPSIVCLIPAGSHAGLARQLEIEVLAKPETA